MASNGCSRGRSCGVAAATVAAPADPPAVPRIPSMTRYLPVALLLLVALACAPRQAPDGNEPTGATNANTNAAVDPTAQVPYDLQSVDFVNISHGWIVGNDEGNNVSVVLRTVDGGATWNVAAEL